MLGNYDSRRMRQESADELMIRNRLYQSTSLKSSYWHEKNIENRLASVTSVGNESSIKHRDDRRILFYSFVVERYWFYLSIRYRIQMKVSRFVELNLNGIKLVWNYDDDLLLNKIVIVKFSWRIRRFESDNEMRLMLILMTVMRKIIHRWLFMKVVEKQNRQKQNEEKLTFFLCRIRKWE